MAVVFSKVIPIRSGLGRLHETSARQSSRLPLLTWTLLCSLMPSNTEPRKGPEPTLPHTLPTSLGGIKTHINCHQGEARGQSSDKLLIECHSKPLIRRQERSHSKKKIIRKYNCFLMREIL